MAVVEFMNEVEAVVKAALAEFETEVRAEARDADVAA